MKQLLNFKKIVFCFSLVLFFALTNSSCQKDPKIVDVHENLLIDSVVAPPYDGVSQVIVNNYVNRLFIDLLGREPDQTELSDAVYVLYLGDLVEYARGLVVDDLMSLAEYFERYHDITSANFLAGVTDQDIQDQIDLVDYVIYLDSLNGNFIEMQLLEIELDKLYTLQNAPQNLMDGIITINEFYGIYVNNLVYDNINMGTENFVKSCFENMLKRSPTDGELTSGVSMVDGAASILFLENGTSKGDFIEIITNNDEFYQGLVIEYFSTLMLRDPSSAEIAEHAEDLKNTGDYKGLQKEIVTSDEYAGF